MKVCYVPPDKYGNRKRCVACENSNRGCSLSFRGRLISEGKRKKGQAASVEEESPDPAVPRETRGKAKASASSSKAKVAEKPKPKPKPRPTASGASSSRLDVAAPDTPHRPRVEVSVPPRAPAGSRTIDPQAHRGEWYVLDWVSSLAEYVFRTEPIEIPSPAPSMLTLPSVGGASSSSSSALGSIAAERTRVRSRINSTATELGRYEAMVRTLESSIRVDEALMAELEAQEHAAEAEDAKGKGKGRPKE